MCIRDRHNGGGAFECGPINVAGFDKPVYRMVYAPVNRTLNDRGTPKDEDLAYYVRGGVCYEIYQGRYSQLLRDLVSEEIQSPLARPGHALPNRLMMWMLELQRVDITSAPVAPILMNAETQTETTISTPRPQTRTSAGSNEQFQDANEVSPCLLYTSPSPRDRTRSRMPSSA